MRNARLRLGRGEVVHSIFAICNSDSWGGISGALVSPDAAVSKRSRRARDWRRHLFLRLPEVALSVASPQIRWQAAECPSRTVTMRLHSAGFGLWARGRPLFRLTRPHRPRLLRLRSLPGQALLRRGWQEAGLSSSRHPTRPRCCLLPHQDRGAGRVWSGPCPP